MTARLQVELYGREVILADREMVESQADQILDGADTEDVAFLVVGDPFGATTHTDLMLRARQQGIKVDPLLHPCSQLNSGACVVQVNVIHNASIMNACGCCGLQLYRFGETVSIPWWIGCAHAAQRESCLATGHLPNPHNTAVE